MRFVEVVLVGPWYPSCNKQRVQCLVCENIHFTRKRCKCKLSKGGSINHKRKGSKRFCVNHEKWGIMELFEMGDFCGCF
jgi:hypothetical protein